jgi:hypothetical protein
MNGTNEFMSYFREVHTPDRTLLPVSLLEETIMGALVLWGCFDSGFSAAASHCIRAHTGLHSAAGP